MDTHPEVARQGASKSFFGRTLWLAIALGLLLAAVLPSPASATYPGRDGDIAVVSSERGAYGDVADLKLVRPGGGVVNESVNKCTRNPPRPGARSACLDDPAFSADGARLVYSVGGRLVVSDADGANRVVLPRQTDNDAEPTWTKRGRLLFTGKQGSARNLYYLNPDGSGLRQLTRGGGRSAAYSNRGLIAYVARGSIRLIRPDGSRRRRFARGDSPDFSPSGRSIAYGDRGAVFVKRLKKRSKRRRIDVYGSDPVFSPSGRRVLYAIFSNPDPNTSGTGILLSATPRGKRKRQVYSAVSGSDITLTNPAWQPRP